MDRRTRAAFGLVKVTVLGQHKGCSPRTGVGLKPSREATSLHEMVSLAEGQFWFLEVVVGGDLGSCRMNLLLLEMLSQKI